MSAGREHAFRVGLVPAGRCRSSSVPATPRPRAGPIAGSGSAGTVHARPRSAARPSPPRAGSRPAPPGGSRSVSRISVSSGGGWWPAEHRPRIERIQTHLVALVLRLVGQRVIIEVLLRQATVHVGGPGGTGRRPRLNFCEPMTSPVPCRCGHIHSLDRLRLNDVTPGNDGRPRTRPHPACMNRPGAVRGYASRSFPADASGPALPPSSGTSPRAVLAREARHMPEPSLRGMGEVTPCSKPVADLHSTYRLSIQPGAARAIRCTTLSPRSSGSSLTARIEQLRANGGDGDGPGRGRSQLPPSVTPRRHGRANTRSAAALKGRGAAGFPAWGAMAIGSSPASCSWWGDRWPASCGWRSSSGARRSPVRWSRRSMTRSGERHTDRWPFSQTPLQPWILVRMERAAALEHGLAAPPARGNGGVGCPGSTRAARGGRRHRPPAGTEGTLPAEGRGSWPGRDGSLAHGEKCCLWGRYAGRSVIWQLWVRPSSGRASTASARDLSRRPARRPANPDPPGRRRSSTLGCSEPCW